METLAKNMIMFHECVDWQQDKNRAHLVVKYSPLINSIESSAVSTTLPEKKKKLLHGCMATVSLLIRINPSCA